MDEEGMKREPGAPAGGNVEVTIRINGIAYAVASGAMQGSALRQVPTPPIGDDYDLVLEQQGGQDLLIRDGQLLDLQEGLSIVAMPRRILAGNPLSDTV